MQAIGFDNNKYLRMQSEKIRERISQFGGKLYLEFGGKLFDDYHASRVLPGFAPDSKVRMLMEMRDEAEIIIAISADDIERSKRRGDLGITYDDDTLRLIDAFQGCGLYVGSVVITHYRGQTAAEKFQHRLEALGIRVYRHYIIPDYPSDIARIVSDDGFGRNDYIETTRSLIVVTAPGPGSGKMATCLSQLYHEHKRGVRAGYAGRGRGAQTCRGDRCAGRRHRDARRHDHHWQDLLPARRELRLPAQCAQVPWRHPEGRHAHLTRHHRADPAPEGRTSRQPQPAPAHR